MVLAENVDFNRKMAALEEKIFEEWRQRSWVPRVLAKAKALRMSAQAEKGESRGGRAVGAAAGTSAVGTRSTPSVCTGIAVVSRVGAEQAVTRISSNAVKATCKSSGRPATLRVKLRG